MPPTPEKKSSSTPLESSLKVYANDFFDLQNPLNNFHDWETMMIKDP